MEKMMSVVRGTEYGCWSNLPVDLIKEDSVVYCFGAGEDLCYEFLLNGLTSSEIHIFDPTPRSKPHFDFCCDLVGKEDDPPYNPAFGGGDVNYTKYIRESKADVERMFFHDYGIYDEDTEIEFYHPQNEDHVSMSIDNLQGTDRFTVLKVMKIDSIMKSLDHDRVDALKLNIEGAEVASLMYMMKETDVRPKLISVKFELVRDKYSEETVKLQNELGNLLLSEYTLLHRDGDNCTFILGDINEDHKL